MAGDFNTHLYTDTSGVQKAIDATWSALQGNIHDRGLTTTKWRTLDRYADVFYLHRGRAKANNIFVTHQSLLALQRMAEDGSCIAYASDHRPLVIGLVTKAVNDVDVDAVAVPLRGLLP